MKPNRSAIPRSKARCSKARCVILASKSTTPSRSPRKSCQPQDAEAGAEALLGMRLGLPSLRRGARRALPRRIAGWQKAISAARTGPDAGADSRAWRCWHPYLASHHYSLSRPFAALVAVPTTGGESPRSLAVLASHCSLVSLGGASTVTLSINEFSASPATWMGPNSIG